MSLLRFWLLGTAVLLAGGLIWAFAPIVVVMMAVLAGLGTLAAGIIWVVRALERRLGRGPPS